MDTTSSSGSAATGSRHSQTGKLLGALLLLAIATGYGYLKRDAWLEAFRTVRPARALATSPPVTQTVRTARRHRAGKAPELRDVTEWVQSDPLTLEQLRGQVVVLHFFAFQ